MELTAQQLDQARGVLVGTACGDALGAPLEFGLVVHYPRPIGMQPGRGWKAGEWTDDTSMAIIIARGAAEHGVLTEAPALDAIAVGFEEWARTAPDVGIQTKAVIAAARAHNIDGVHMTLAAKAFADATAHADGNGSLMRTAPVALAFLDDPAGLAAAARAVSSLTHAGVDSTDACVLWTSAIRVAVMEGKLDGLRAGLEYIAPERRALWLQRIEEAEGAEPWDFPNNGWVVHALQAAWSAITCDRPHEGVEGLNAFTHGIDHAVRCGHDTDTVAAIAGGVLGGLHGLAAVPTEWRELLNGWPGMGASDLVALTDTLVGKVGA